MKNRRIFLKRHSKFALSYETLTHDQKQTLHDIYNIYKLIFINVLNIKVVNELNSKPSPRVPFRYSSIIFDLFWDLFLSLSEKICRFRKFIFQQGNIKVKNHSFLQGSKRDKTIADKFIYILNDDTQNYPFCKIQLVV